MSIDINVLLQDDCVMLTLMNALLIHANMEDLV